MFTEVLTTSLQLLGTPVSPSVIPFGWGTTLHAARISLVFNTLKHSSKSNLSFGANLIGYLLMCWGGSIGTHVLLGLPPPQLYAIGPWMNYSTVHILLTSLFNYIPVPNPTTTNLVLFPLDGLLRANSVLVTLSMLKLPSVNPLLAASPLFHFILGAVASAGGGLLGTTLSVWTESWQLSTPPPLRAGVWGLWSTLDIWAGGVVAVVYGILTAHPAFPSLLGEEPASISAARASSAALMIAFFALRVFVTPLTSPRPPPVAKKSGKKEKTQ
ncbi:hypothetical protein MKEN_00655700 [Mycena kentingensis (nom. inval.)]|nr:hypothetical protein MKEN_00655700 [Mycena kentingensis (nom. inval.)]